jgi:hypothetical protein
MKKLLLTGAALCLIHIAFSQTRFGIRGGLNISNLNIKATYMGQSLGQSGDAIPTFHVGGMADIPLSELFSIQPSLLLSGKGANLDDGSGNKAKIRPYYLEVPVLLLVRGTLSNSQLKIFGGAGPSIGYGLFGKATSQGQSDDVFSSDGFKRFDFGIDLTAGVELAAGFQFSFHFTPGLANVGPGNDPTQPGLDYNVKNKVIQFSIGYFFAGGNK